MIAEEKRAEKFSSRQVDDSEANEAPAQKTMPASVTMLRKRKEIVAFRECYGAPLTACSSGVRIHPR